MKSRQPPGTLIAIDSASGSALATAAHALKADGFRGAGISEWDASGIFGELEAADGDAGAPSARVLVLLYAADLAFRLRWEIRPALEQGRTVIAAPYVATAIAFGRAAGLPAAWLKELFLFAPRPDDSRRAPAHPAKAHHQGFVEFACQQVAGARTGLFRDQLMKRAGDYMTR
jgi:dTMP kinase